MTNYLLTILMNDIDDEIINEVLDIISVNMDGDEFKFDCIGTTILAHFVYDGDHSELYNLLMSEFEGFVEGFILTELFDNEIIMFSDNEKIEQLGIPNIEDYIGEEFHQNLHNFLYETKLMKVMPKVVKYDIDTILDKINSSGIDSLTNAELEYLNKIQ